MNRYKNMDLDKAADAIVFLVTQDYIRDIFGPAASVFNIHQLAVSAQKMRVQLARMHRQHDYQILQHPESAEGQRLLAYYDCTMFYEYYPALHDFATKVANLCKGEYPHPECCAPNTLYSYNRKYHLTLACCIDEMQKNLNHT